MPKKTSQKPKEAKECNCPASGENPICPVHGAKIAILPDMMLKDETNAEFFKGVELIQFLSWMKKGGHRLPETLPETHRLCYEYLLHERRVMVEFVKKERRKNQRRSK